MIDVSIAINMVGAHEEENLREEPMESSVDHE